MIGPITVVGPPRWTGELELLLKAYRRSAEATLSCAERLEALVGETAAAGLVGEQVEALRRAIESVRVVGHALAAPAAGSS